MNKIALFIIPLLIFLDNHLVFGGCASQPPTPLAIQIEECSFYDPEKDEQFPFKKVNNDIIKSNKGLILKAKVTAAKHLSLGSTEIFFYQTDHASDCEQFQTPETHYVHFILGCPMVPFDLPAGIRKKIIPNMEILPDVKEKCGKKPYTVQSIVSVADCTFYDPRKDKEYISKINSWVNIYYGLSTKENIIKENDPILLNATGAIIESQPYVLSDGSQKSDKFFYRSTDQDVCKKFEPAASYSVLTHNSCTAVPYANPDVSFIIVSEPLNLKETF